MKTASLIKALGRIGVKAETSERNKAHWFARNDGGRITWFDQCGRVICLNVARHDDRDDSQSDYSAVCFHYTIVSAIRHLSELAAVEVPLRREAGADAYYIDKDLGVEPF